MRLKVLITIAAALIVFNIAAIRKDMSDSEKITDTLVSDYKGQEQLLNDLNNKIYTLEDKIDSGAFCGFTWSGISCTGEEIKPKKWDKPDSFEPIDCELGEDIQEFLYYICEDYSISFEFVMALIDYESGYNPNEISPTNDYGLMQINKCNHKWLAKNLGITNFLDPYQNILAGMYMLHDLFQKYDDSSRVLMAYNMGESTATRLWNNGKYSTGYTNEVYKRLDNLKYKGAELCIN